MDFWKEKFPAMFPGTVETMKVVYSQMASILGVTTLTKRSVKIYFSKQNLSGYLNVKLNTIDIKLLSVTH